MEFRLAIFDWNGTTLDDLPVVYGSVREIFRTYGLPAPSLDEYREEITTDFMKFYEKHGLIGAKPEDLNAIRKRYLAEHGHDAKLHKGAKDLIELCRNIGLQTAIVSAEIPEVLEKKLSEFGIFPLVDRITGGAYDKPKALIETLDFLGVQAEKAFYLDDTFDGLMAAKSVGITTIGFCNGYNSRKRIMYAEPDFPNAHFPQILTHADVREIILRGGEL